MALRQRLGFLMDRGQRTFEIGSLESFQCAVGGQRLIQLAQHTHVVDDVAEVLGFAAGVVLVQTVHPGNGLQQGVILEPPRQIQHGVAWRVEAGQKLVHHDQNFRLVAVLERIDDGFVVVLLRAVALHHALPERHDRISGFLGVDLVKALAFVGRRDDHLASDCTQLVQKRLVAQRGRLVGRHQLRLKAGTLPVLAVMLADVEGAHVDHLLGLVQHLGTGVFLFQVGLLLVSQPLGVALEPDVDGGLVLLQLHHAPFVEQRHDGAVGHRLVDGIGVDHAAELGHIALLARQEWRAGEADIAGIREHLPHARRVTAQLGALGFVHQHEDVGRGIAELLVGQRLVEFVHQRGDDVRLAVGHQFHQMAAALGTVGREPAGGEGVAELLVQIHPVGHQQDARIADRRLQRQRAGQHHHGQRLARALGVPDDAAPALAAVVRLLDAGEHLANGEHLLVARDLAHAAVEHGEGPGHLQQALRPAQGVERAVLLGHLPANQVGRNLLAHAQFGKGQIEQ